MKDYKYRHKQEPKPLIDKIMLAGATICFIILQYLN